VVDPTDPAALADKIRFMANEPEAAREMGEGAHQMFRDGFTEEIHFGRLARAYNEVVPSSVAPIELDGLSTR
jgi:glycosyltransferase involved in cell wall biosynthesis